MREIGGPIFINRYNLYTAASVQGNLRPGISTGDAIGSVDKSAEENLAITMNKDWTELMFMQIRAGNTAIYVFALSVACVFLALAASTKVGRCRWPSSSWCRCASCVPCSARST